MTALILAGTIACYAFAARQVWYIGRDLLWDYKDYVLRKKYAAERNAEMKAAAESVKIIEVPAVA